MTHLVLSQLTKRFGDATAVDGIDLSVADGEAVVLLGPSGCGKTTCLRMIAGFERPDHGEIRLGDRTLAGPGTFVPPERRRMSVVFQSYALWPHMTVDQNVGYGPTTAKVGRAEVRRRVAEALAMVQLPDMGERYVHQLSGGQQQRVALARALVNDPALLLLDEPLSNLDTRLREELRAEVKRIQRSLGVSMLYVTHDQAEALSLADRLVVMNAGTIVQLGEPEEVYRRPRNSYVARALGATNIVTASVSPAGRGYLRVLGNVDVATAHELRGGADVAVSIRPADVALVPVEDDAEATGRITETLFFGDLVQYQLDVPGEPVPVRANGPGSRRLAVGTRVRVEVEPDAAAVLDDPVRANADPVPLPAGAS
jgi:ABC-type Fe3+/spermidine/putrescine transport system ATPase subunit